MAHDHPHDIQPNRTGTAPAPACGPCCGAAEHAPVASVPAPPGGGQRFRIPAMDCASEESEIRRAVEGVPGVLGLRFQLGERSLRIAGEPQAALAAVEAIRNTGFEVHAWPDASGVDQRRGWIGPRTRARCHHRLRLAPPARCTRPCHGSRGPVLPGPGRTLVEVGGPGGRCRSHRTGRIQHLQQGSDRPAARPPEHQRADVGGRHGSLRHRPMARGSHGHGALRHRRADRSPCRGPRAQCHQRPAGALTRHRRPAAARRHLEDSARR